MAWAVSAEHQDNVTNKPPAHSGQIDDILCQNDLAWVSAWYPDQLTESYTAHTAIVHGIVHCACRHCVPVFVGF